MPSQNLLRPQHICCGGVADFASSTFGPSTGVGSVRSSGLVLGVAVLDNVPSALLTVEDLKGERNP